jgi:hypothetical protein
LLLIRNAVVYAPRPLGQKKLLIGGNIIPGISDRIGVPQGLDVEVFDAKGFISAGIDADLLFLDPEMRVVHLLAIGKWVVRSGEVVKKGAYE